MNNEQPCAVAETPFSRELRQASRTPILPAIAGQYETWRQVGATLWTNLAKQMRPVTKQLRRVLQRKRTALRRGKLQLQEMQRLGEKRYVAIVRVGQRKFLVGGGADSVTLLADLSRRSREGANEADKTLPAPTPITLDASA